MTLSSLFDRIRGHATPEAGDPHLVPLAAATLLFEVALADQEVAEEELAVVRSALTEQFELSDEDVRAVMRDSRNQYDESVGLYRFTRTLVDAWDEPKRFDLLVQLWRLALSDARLDRFEEHTIRKIADLLYVSHARFIEAKQQARRLVDENG